jgi:RNA polymerase sigma factor (sigma-70 family)
MTRGLFEREVEAARGKVFNRARKRGFSVDDAEDLTQDAMLVALGKAEWREIENVTGYLLQIVDFLIANARRKHTASTGFDLDDIPAAESATNIKNGHEVDLHVDLARSEKRAAYVAQECHTNPIDDLIERLNHQQEVEKQMEIICAAAEKAGLTTSEELVLLARLQDKEYDEIATILGLGRDSCATYNSNALCKIRRVVAAETEFPPAGQDLCEVEK